MKKLQAKIELFIANVQEIKAGLMAINPLAEAVGRIDENIYQSNLKFTQMIDLLEKANQKATRVAKAHKTNTKAIEEGAAAMQRFSITGAGVYDNVNNKLIRTTLASQQLIRIVQDAPFGPMGWINNVQELSMSFSHLTKQLGSSSLAMKAMLTNLVKGGMMFPMAIAAVTALILAWDKIVDAGKAIIGIFKGVNGSVAAYTKALKEAKKQKIGDIFSEDMKLEDLRLYNEQLTKIYGGLRDIAAVDANTQGGPTWLKEMTVDVNFALTQIPILSALMEDEAKKHVITAKAVEDMQIGLVQKIAEAEAQIFANAMSFLVNIRRNTKEMRQAEIDAEAKQIAAMDTTLNKLVLNFEDRMKESGLVRDKELAEIKNSHRDAMNAIRNQKEDLIEQSRRMDEAVKIAREQFEGEDLARAEENYKKQKALISSQLASLGEEELAEKEKLQTELEDAELAHQRRILDIKLESYDLQLSAQERYLDAALQQTEAFYQREVVAADLNKHRLLQLQLQQLEAEKQIEIQRMNAKLEFYRQQEAAGLALNAVETRDREHLQERLFDIDEDYGAKRTELQREFQREMSSFIISNSLSTLSELSAASQTIFNSWQSQRQAELEQQGYSEQEKTNILRKEGRSRFAFMKALMIAEATGNAINAGISIYEGTLKAYQGSPWAIPLAAAQAAGVVGTLMARVAQIKALTIGGGGSSASGGGSGNKAGFTSLNQFVTADRAANFERERSGDVLNRAATNAANEDLVRAINNLGDKLTQAYKDTPVVIGDREADMIRHKGEIRKAKVYQ